MTVILTIILLFGFLLIGVPIGISLALSGSIGLFLVGGFQDVFTVLATSPYRNTATWGLTTLVLFVLMANFLSNSRLASDMYSTVFKWVGHWPGGLAIATVFTGAGLGAVSGSSPATASVMAQVAGPEMVKHGYNPKMAYGVVATAGTLATLIPPSTPLIIYGIITETSIGDLFLAAIIPGLISALIFIFVTIGWVKFDPKIAKKIDVKPTYSERFRSLGAIWPIIILFSIIIIGIYTGIFTIIETAGIAAIGALIISLIMRRMNRETLLKSFEDTTKTSAMVFMMIIGGNIFGYFLSFSGVTQNILITISELGLPKMTVLLIVVVIYLILGFFMDQMAILFITLPITFPLLSELGYHPLWIAIIIAKTIEIGLVTPPVGLNVFVTSAAAKIRTGTVFAGAAPYVIFDGFISLSILILLPEVALWLPKVAG